jgi:ABC-2 type transport system permease protein
MLWYKAWLETRSRFLICLLGMVALCSFIVYHGDKEALPYTKLNYYYFVLRSGHSMLATMWIAAVTLLLMGGILREKAVGTATFTLALPVSRARLMRVRIGIGLLQAVALAVIPSVAMWITAITTGKVNDGRQPAFYLALLLGGGLVFFSMALLISSLVEGEYTAPVASFGVMLAMTVVLGEGPFRDSSPFGFINGLAYYSRYTGLLSGPIPWGHIAIYFAISALLTALSMLVVQRREF